MESQDLVLKISGLVTVSKDIFSVSNYGIESLNTAAIWFSPVVLNLSYNTYLSVLSKT